MPRAARLLKRNPNDATPIPPTLDRFVQLGGQYRPALPTAGKKNPAVEGGAIKWGGYGLKINRKPAEEAHVKDGDIEDKTDIFAGWSGCGRLNRPMHGENVTPSTTKGSSGGPASRAGAGGRPENVRQNVSNPGLSLREKYFLPCGAHGRIFLILFSGL